MIVPFRGGEREARRMVAALDRLVLRAGDELVVAENQAPSGVRALAAAPITVVPATRERSAYHARNAGAADAGGDWLLFLDADCAPDPNLLDAHLAMPPARDCGALAGQVEGDPAQRGLVARYMASRGFFRQDAGLLAASGVAGAANLLVRRDAFEALGGFAEGIRSGGDIDLCRRLRLRGWRVEPRVGAVVRHHHRDRLTSLLRAIARYAAGSRWLNDRHPGSSPSWPLLPGLAGAAADVARAITRGEAEEAAFRGIDAAGLVAHAVGYRRGNRASAPAG